MNRNQYIKLIKLLENTEVVEKLKETNLDEEEKKKRRKENIGMAARAGLVAGVGYGLTKTPAVIKHLGRKIVDG